MSKHKGLGIWRQIHKMLVMLVMLTTTFGSLTPLLSESVSAAQTIQERVASLAEARTVGTQGGQCKVFVQNILSQAGITLGSSYYNSYLAIATQISADQAGRGDIIQMTDPKDLDGGSNGALHTAIIVGKISSGNFQVVDSNWGHPDPNNSANWILDEAIQNHPYNPQNLANQKGGVVLYFRLKDPSNPNQTPPVSSSSSSSTGTTLVQKTAYDYVRPLVNGYYVFSTCYSGRAKIFVDNKLVFYTKGDDGSKPSQSGGMFLTPRLLLGTYEMRIEYWGVDGGPTPGINQFLYPLNLVIKTACGADTVYPVGSEPSSGGSGSGGSIAGQTVGVDKMAFVRDVTIPDYQVVTAGAQMTKTWRVRNAGTSVWQGFKLVFESGDRMGGPASIDIPVTSPGNEIELSVPLTIPNYSAKGYWKIVNAQGTKIDQGSVWVFVTVSNPGGSSSGTTSSATPQSGTLIVNANYPNVVAPGQKFRPTISVQVTQGQLMESRGDMLRNTDNNLYGAWPHVAVTGTVNAGQTYSFQFYADNPITAPNAEGSYDSHWRVWRNGGWDGAEINIHFDVRNGGAPRPNAPIIQGPQDWYVSRDGSAPNLCVNQIGGVEYYFEIYQSHDIPSSGWISSNCWRPSGLGAFGYQWHVKVRAGGLESDWSETRHFNIDSQELTMDNIQFGINSPSAGDLIRIYTCVRGFGGIGLGLSWAANTATDGSASGQWMNIDTNGTFCYNQSDQNTWPIWNTLNLADGTHLIRATGYHAGNTVTKDVTYTLGRRRPDHTTHISPSDNIWLNTKQVTFTWGATLRATSYQFVISTDDSQVNKVFSQTIAATAQPIQSITLTLPQDYQSAYWFVTPVNELGTNGSTRSHLGIDLELPTSAVTVLPAKSGEVNFSVLWSSNDPRSGVRWYDIQYKDGVGGDWLDWQSGTDKLGAIFYGQAGHTYYFRSRAMDVAGNQESWGDADTQTTIDLSSQATAAWWDASYQLKRNLIVLNNDSAAIKAGYPTKMHFDASTNPTAAEIYNASTAVAKGNDVRITQNNTTELSRYVQNFSASKIDIWFQVKANIPGNNADSSSYQLYIGNPTATNPPGDIDSVMAQAKDANTVGLWHFMDGAGSTFVDTSGKGHNGTLAGAYNWGEDSFGPYIEFPNKGNGTGYGQVASSPDFDLNQMTIEAWIYTSLDPNNEMAVVYRPASDNDCPAYKMAVSDLNNDFHLNCAAGRDIGGGSLTKQKWYYLANTYDGTNMRIYINGQLIRTVPYSTSVRSAAGKSLFIGGASFTQTFNGRIKNVKISNVVRTDFSAGANVAAINSVPTIATGSVINKSSLAPADLSLQSVTAYPDPQGGIQVEAVVLNQGENSTVNGFNTDLYLGHQPTGTGDTTNSIHFWSNEPVAAGSTTTLTTTVDDLSSLPQVAGLNMQANAQSTMNLFGQADTTGAVSETSETNNINTSASIACVLNPDSFEPDNSIVTASSLALATEQQHNLTRFQDEDWIKVTLTGGQKYRFYTYNTGGMANTDMYLYSADGSTLLVSNNDKDNSTLDSEIIWTATSTDTYLIKVKHLLNTVGGCATGYSFKYENYTQSSSSSSVSSSSSSSVSSSATSTTSSVSGTCDQTNQFCSEFYNTKDLTGPIVFQNAVATPQYDWGGNAPFAGVNADNFSARWTGKITFAAGTYRFKTTSDDGIRLSIDGTAVIDDWNDHGMTDDFGTVILTAGVHTLKMEYFDSGGGAIAWLEWTTVVASSSESSSTSSAPACDSNNQFCAQYYNTKDLTGNMVATNSTSTINYDWGGNAPFVGVNADNFSTRWTGNFTFAAGSYKLTSITDDGVKVYVDGTAVINNWTDHGMTTDIANVTLTAGVHTIKMEYFDSGGGAIAQLEWTTVAASSSSASGSSSLSSSSSSASSSSSSASSSTSSVPACSQVNQFCAEYYNNTGLSGAVAATNSTPAINYDWGLGSPLAGVNSDNFSVRWTGQFTFAAGSFKFTTTSDDGVRVYIDGTVVINNWTDHGTVTDTGSIALTAGVHTIKMEFYDGGEDAIATLNWVANPVSSSSASSSASSSLSSVSSSSSSTSSSSTSSAAACTNTFCASYFNNVGLTGATVYTNTIPAINYDWGSNSPATGVNADNFSTRWIGNFTLTAGTYTFTAVSDDGIRAWVDSTQIINNWTDHGSVTDTKTITLTAGVHVLKVEYHESGGGAVAKFSWSNPIASCDTANTFCATYFNNVNFTGTPVYSNKTTTVNFDWGSGGPGNGVAVDSFSARYIGTFSFTAGNHKFTTITDDGLRLYVDNVLIIDNWVDHGSVTDTKTISLTAGNHEVRYEYHESGGGAVSKLSWN